MNTIPNYAYFASLILLLALPVFSSVVRSLLVIVVATPLLAILSVVAFVSFSVFYGYLLDKRQPRRPSNGLRRIARPLSFSSPAAWQALITRSQWSYKSPQSLPPLRPDLPSVSGLINELLILIVRDFVLVWYKDISSSPSFPVAVSTMLHGSMDKLLDRLDKIDLSSLIVKRLLPKITAHVDQFRLSETDLRGAGLERHLTQSDELDLLLASRYAGRGGKLHPAVDNLSSMFTKQSEEAHLREMVDQALPYILPQQDANSKAVRIVAREIVACSVIGPILDLLADPDFWNRTIDDVAGAAIHQRKLISKVRNVLEAQSPIKHLSTPAGIRSETITLRTDARHFDSFLRSISRTDSLLDARRLKNDIAGEIRRTRTLLASHENEDWIGNQKTEDVVAFLDRLYMAKRKVEKRIRVLGGQDDSQISLYQDSSITSRLSLRDILTNPSSLSYFMEFMDRRGRSLLVQFWLTVESFKDPLESVDSDVSEEEEDVASVQIPSPNLKEDISMINDLYFSGLVVAPVLMAISKKYVDVIKSFSLDTEAAPPSLEKKVRRSVLLAQRQVERDMDQDFEDFERSELWFRAVSDMQPKEQQPMLAAVAPPLQPKASSSSTLSSTSLLASLVPGFAADLQRVAGYKPTAPSLPRSESYPILIQERRASTGSSKSNVGLAAPANPGHAKPPRNLDILMASSDTSSRAPLFEDSVEQNPTSPEAEEAQRMDAIQAAVTDIIANESRAVEHPPFRDRTHSSDSIMTRTTSNSTDRLSHQLRSGLFSDTHDTEGLEQIDEREEGGEMGEFKLALPGDLQLSIDITRLSDKIVNLQSQDVMLDALIRKAELTGDAEELRLLQKSKSSLGREIRQLTFQKSQYEQQDAANKLVPGSTKASIVNSTTGEEDGKSVVRYLIEVQQSGPNGTHASGWVVARRYNEFFNMHQRLRERFLLVRNLDFPGKRLVTALSSSLVDTRRVALEKYLQNLLAIPMVCESEELRAFLSRESPFMAAELPVSPPASSTNPKEPSNGASASAFLGQRLVRSVYRSFADSFDDLLFGPSMLEVMIGRLTRQAAEFTGIVGSGVTDEDLVAQALKGSASAANADGKEASPEEETLMRLPGDLKPLEGESGSSSFTSPICDLILAVFELDKKNNWLRRQAIVIILQQVLGDTIERKLRDSVKTYTDEVHVVGYLNILKEALWPGGRLKQSGPPRTAEQRFHTKEQANRKLSALFPDIAANMIGRSNARRGARRAFTVLQNRRLNQHIIYTVLDEIFAALFPEVLNAPPVTT